MKRFKNWRINFVLALIILVGLIVVGRLFYIEVLNRKLYKAEALGQQVGFASVTGDRGEIFCQDSQDSQGASGTGDIESLAINKDSWDLSVTISEISDKEKFAEILSPYIGVTKSDLLAQLAGQDDYVIVKKGLSSEELDNVKKLNLQGLYWQNDPDRFYPQGSLASQALGFLGGSGEGQYGVEGYYDNILKGKAGVVQEETGLDAVLSNDNDSQTSLNGADIYLTIDYNIQFEAEALLRKYQSQFNMDAAQIIVMKPDTGRILAMVNSPSFDVNQYAKVSDLDTFQNGAVQKLFEPGSIMKPFTMAAALNEGKITPDTTYTDTGAVQFGSQTIHNFDDEKYGVQNMTQVLESSINTGAVFAEEQIPHTTFLDYLDKFGFFQKTGVDLQGEVYSNNDLLKNGPDIEFATAAFGQGIELTPLQIARGFCAIANGGKLVKPYIVDKVVNGDDITYTKPEISQPIVSQSTLTQLNTMLIAVVDKGFGGIAKIPGYYIAGKTGTAQVPLVNGNGYDPDKTIQSFVGYGPAYNPQFLILVKLDNPKVSKAALSAVPIFKDLANYIINYWKIPPDYDPNAVVTK